MRFQIFLRSSNGMGRHDRVFQHLQKTREDWRVAVVLLCVSWELLKLLLVDVVELGAT